MPLFRKIFSRPNGRLALVAAALVLVLAAWFSRPLWTRPNPLVTTPSLAIAALPAGSIYFNAPARPWLIAERPDSLTGEDRDPNSERAKEFRQAVQNPKLFRQ